jgi:thiol-disulfide isomerase/thioredoxin
MAEVRKPADILVVTASGCHYCNDALRLLDELGEATPLTVRTLNIHSEEGRALIVRYRIPFPPILVVDGVFFGYGRISRRKLESHLAQRAQTGLVV